MRECRCWVCVRVCARVCVCVRVCVLCVAGDVVRGLCCISVTMLVSIVCVCVLVLCGGGFAYPPLERLPQASRMFCVCV